MLYRIFKSNKYYNYYNKPSIFKFYFSKFISEDLGEEKYPFILGTGVVVYVSILSIGPIDLFENNCIQYDNIQNKIS